MCFHENHLLEQDNIPNIRDLANRKDITHLCWATNFFKCFWQEQCRAGDEILQKSDAFALNCFCKPISCRTHIYTDTHALIHTNILNGH